MRGRGFVRVLIAALVLASIATAVGLDVVRANGYLKWDDAQYLYRGIYHARQVSRHAHLWVPRLVYSLSFEAPKPPLYTGWIALGALIFGYAAISKLLFWSTAPVLCALLAAVFWSARERSGQTSAWVAVACFVSFPGALLFSGSLMVETMLGLWILLSLIAATLWLKEPTPLHSVLLGVAIGLAFLTKLTAAMFLLPMLAYAVVVLAGRRGVARVVASGLAVTAATLATCGWWYARKLSEAVEFARWSSRFPGFVGRVSLPDRLMQVFTESVGWWWAAIGAILIAAILARGSRTIPSPPADFLRMAFLSAGFALFVVCVTPYFDPRFLVPIAPVLAVVAGGAVSSVLYQRSVPALAIAGIVLLGGVALSVWSYRTRRPGASIQDLAVVICQVNARFPSKLRLGLVGSDSRFNFFQIELAEGLQSDYTKAELVDLNDRTGGEWNSFDGLDAVLAVAPCPAAGAYSVQYLNRNCESLRKGLEARVSLARRSMVKIAGEERRYELFDLRGGRG